VLEAPWIHLRNSSQKHEQNGDAREDKNEDGEMWRRVLVFYVHSHLKGLGGGVSMKGASS
jgi:hypothetical protein